METQLKKIEETILGQFPRQDELMDLMAVYHLRAGGKRFRAQLAIAQAKDLAIPFSDAMKWAVACELLHNATLVHDDIQDEDPLRRGQPSVWAKFGRDQAINLGDYLIFSAFEVISTIDIKRAIGTLLACLSRKAKDVACGQALEIHMNHLQPDNLWQTYLRVAELKTGALLQAPIEGVYLLAGEPVDVANEKSQNWLKLGLVYQINDDINDFLGRKQANQSFKDFFEQKTNSLVAWLSLDNNNRELIRDYLHCEKESDEQAQIIKQLSHRIIKNGVLDDLIHIKKTFFQQFQSLGPSTAGEMLNGYLMQMSEGESVDVATVN